MECPVCSCKVEANELERHVNNHLDEDEISRDQKLAEYVAAAPSPRQEPSPEYVLCSEGCGQIILLTELENHFMLHDNELEGRNGDDSIWWLDGGLNRVSSEQKQDAGCSRDHAIIPSNIRTSQQKDRFVPVQEGIMSILKKCLVAEGQRNSAYAITSYIDHFQSFPEDLGWGCGWRNIQMLSSYLLAKDEGWKKALYGGAGYVPNIASLQQWLELAWSKGYDPSGAEHFNWNIFGSKKWIGTTECATLLRSFGVRAQIADFKVLNRKLGGKGGCAKHVSKRVVSGSNSRKRHEISKGRPAKPPQVSKFSAMEVHGTRLIGTSSSSGESHASSSDADVVNHQRLVDWVWNYYTDSDPSLSADTLENRSSSSVFVSSHPPLYFQHQGHSRTIVGMQRRRKIPGGPEEAFLLVLDPSQHTEDLAKALRAGIGWQKLIKRGVHTLRKAEYQICYVDPGIATGKELEQMKTLTSLSYLY